MTNSNAENIGKIKNNQNFMNHPSSLYLILFSLYWAQGLPVGFMTQALPVILRAEGVSLAHIGGFGLLMLPWSIKILWAPLIDRQSLFLSGHYRSWILPTQLMTVLILFLLSFFPIDSLGQTSYLLLFFILLFSMNLMGATQDIATDGLAVNILKSQQQHWGNTMQVVGSRLGFVVGGGLLLWCLDILTWQITFLGLALLVLLNTWPIYRFQEAQKTPRHSKQLHHVSTTQSISIKKYLHYFLQDAELRRWLMVLLSFKIADGLMGPLLKPLMVDMGLSFTEIGLYITSMGAVAALVGAFVAGWLLRFWSRVWCLVVFSMLKLCSVLAYVGLAYAYEYKILLPKLLIYMVNAFEDAIAAMLLVVMLTLVMHYSRKHLAGTDFTFQVALMATVSGLLYIVSGVVADIWGYFYYLIAILIIAGLSLLPVLSWINYKNLLKTN